MEKLILSVFYVILNDLLEVASRLETSCSWVASLKATVENPRIFNSFSDYQNHEAYWRMKPDGTLFQTSAPPIPNFCAPIPNFCAPYSKLLRPYSKLLRPLFQTSAPPIPNFCAPIPNFCASRCVHRPMRGPETDLTLYYSTV